MLSTRNNKYLSIGIFLIIITLNVSLNSCTSEEKYSLSIDSLQTYGDNEKNIMSIIGDYKYHKEKVYILDIIQKKIFIYNLNGKIAKQIQLRTGKGPGDFTMGIFAFDVISDTSLAIVDNMLNRIQIISTNNKYINSFYTDFMPNDIFYRDSLLYIAGNDIKRLIYVYNLKGEKLDSLITPFKLKNQPQPWFSKIAIEQNGAFYTCNPYKTEIIKWEKNKKIWTFNNNKLNLVSLPIVRNRSGKITMRNADKGWAKIFVYKNYLISTTYNYKSESEGEVKPKILIIDKNTGKLLFIQTVKTQFLADSFERGKYVFSVVNEPYPHLERIFLKIYKR